MHLVLYKNLWKKIPGRHILLEKPIAMTPKSCERIIEASRKLIPKKVFMVAENSAHWPEIVQTKKTIEQGNICTVLTTRTKCWESADIQLNEWAAGYLPEEWNCTW